MQQPLRLAVLWAVAIAALIGMMLVDPIPQPLSYHGFADQRTLLGIQNFWNVISNVPFLFVGMAGVATVLRNDYPGGLPSLRVLYGVFFVGVALVCFGSGYYHLHPSNETLLWDRLPIAVAFMAFVAIVAGEHIDERLSRMSVLPLMALGAYSVWYWGYTETLGRGDLRLYGLVQFLSMTLVVLTFLLFPSRLSHMKYVWGMVGGYALAKVFEALDSAIYSFGHVMSGHALKHFAAAAGMYCFVLALKRRAPR
jgi:hypothetical protein